MFFVVSGGGLFKFAFSKSALKNLKLTLERNADFKFTCYLFRLIIRVIIWPFMVSSNFRVICAVFVSFLAKKGSMAKSTPKK